MRLYCIGEYSSDNFDILLKYEQCYWGVDFNDVKQQKQELINYVLYILRNSYWWDTRLLVCLKLAKQINMYDKLMPIILLSKYNKLLNDHL